MAATLAAVSPQASAQVDGPPWPILTEYVQFDTTRTVAVPGDTFLVYRTEVALRFKDGVTDRDKAVFFSAHHLTVSGVTSVGTFFLRIRDPGPSWKAFKAVLDSLRADPRVSTATLIPHTPIQEDLPGAVPAAQDPPVLRRPSPT